jgi:hypothetical protein
MGLDVTVHLSPALNGDTIVFSFTMAKLVEGHPLRCLLLAPAVHMSHMQLMVLVPPMASVLPMEGVLWMGHAVPMALQVVCTSVLLAADDSPRGRRVDGRNDELINVMVPLFHR